MKRSELKDYIFQVLLEAMDCPYEVEGSLVQKTMGFSGYETRVVCEGTVGDANEFAREHNFSFVKSDDSHFGGYYEAEHNTIYEFIPSDEYYGELMEAEMSASDALARLNGDNDQILQELDNTQITNFIRSLMDNADFVESRVVPVFTNVATRVMEGMSDPKQVDRLLGVIITQGLKTEFTENVELSNNQHRLALENLRTELDTYIKSMTDVCESCVTTDYRGILLKNYGRVLGTVKDILPTT
tara:strand:+ start:37090 stop:37818 length:729 start_codon:yes stop_codon:yes gene_type:complete